MSMYRTLASHAVRCLAGICAILIVSSVAVAQQPAPRPAAPRPAAPAGAPGGVVPAGRIAIINTAAFPEKIAELQRKIVELNTRFEPRTKELQSLRDTISGIEAQVNQGGVAPGQAAQLSERYEQLKREYTRKSEDLSAEAQRAYGTATDPIRQKLSDAIEKYAADHKIVVILDISGAVKTGSLFYAAENTNITDDFLAQYNRANP
ncbi:MAG TPA: OmpH family outer membrane protein [Blastocatellia bacterium]|nr:OmpH family outer membrane protein [Blastocatellia bacterium]